MATLKRGSGSQKSETKVVPDEKDGTRFYVDESPQEDATATGGSDTGEDGQLALDVFQTTDEIVVVAPIAGVSSSDIGISITDEVLTIRGNRNLKFKASPSDYFTQECFWGNFSRSIILPESVDTSKVVASFKNGILTVRIPKVERIRTRLIKIKEE